MRSRRLGVRSFLTAVFVGVITLSAATGDGAGSISRDDLKEWLSYIASDDMEGRALYSTGLGLAAGYIADHLARWPTRPAGDGSSYLQTVKILSVRATGRSTVTVDVNGQTRTFEDSQGVTFPANVGSKRRFTVDRVEFAGYGLDIPRARHVDYAGKDVKGAAVVWLGARGPRDVDTSLYRVILSGRDRYAIQQLGAVASIGPERPDAGGAARAARAGGAGRGRGANQIATADFTTVEHLDRPQAPDVAGSDDFFRFLFSRAPVSYDELKRKAEAQDPLPAFRLDGVKLSFNLDDEYDIVRTQLAHNVVALVEGSDPQLKNTYVALGAHYDHVGYAQAESADGSGSRRFAPPPYAFSKPGAENDRIWNGADDDGSGTVALMALAKAFAEGPRPKRSVLFVWHTGEESGRYGSLFYADYPTVPMDRIVAQLNIDMIGRNRDDRSSESNTVYLVGSDRISSELHAISRAANDALPKPMVLAYDFNDPSDPEQLYFRSDHYSYAAKGVPIIFFTTGLHPDYHTQTDEVSKIDFDKMTRVTGLVYETAWRLANLDHAPARDNQGPRAIK